MNLQQELDELMALEQLDEAQTARVEEIKKLLAEEAVEKRIQSETDKVRGKYVKELKDLQAQLDGLKNAKLTDEEKAEKDKAEKEKLLADKEAQLLKRELDFETMTLLADKKLDKDFLQFLTATTLEDRKTQLDLLEKHINLKIQQAVKDKLGQSPTPANTTTNNTLRISKEEFAKMGYAEKAQLFLTDADLYNTLKNS